MNNSKNTLNKVLITVLKYLFFVGTLVFIYYKVFRYHSFNDVYHQLTTTLNVTSILYFVGAFIMIFFNWGLESEKWRLMMQRTFSISILTSLKATFAGTSFGIFTPNRSGSFVGNLLFVPAPYKAEAAICVWISSISQFLATVSFGFIGILLMQIFHLPIPLGEYSMIIETSGIIAFLAILFVGYLAYFNTRFFITSFKKIKWIANHIDKLESLSTFSKANLFKYWGLSMLRYMVFAVQFFFVFKAFKINIPFADFFVYVCLLYAIITFLPSVLGKLGVREAALLILLSNTPFSDIQIISASFSLWALNVVLPAIFGAFFITQIKTT